MSMRRILVTMIGLGLAASVSGAAVGRLGQGPQKSAAESIRAARLLDPASGKYSAPVVVVIDQGRITDVLTGEAARSKTATTDFGNVTLLPGLIDAHVHLEIGGTPEGNALAVLRAGFTTVVDLGATSDAVFRLRQAIEKGELPGPAILAAGQWIGKRGGICDFGGIGVQGTEAFRARARSNLERGADLLKVCVTGWPDAAFARPAEYEIAYEALEAVVQEAHRAKRLVIAHCISSGGVDVAVRAGVDGLAHAAFIDETDAVRLRKHGIFVIPTLASFLGATTPPAAEALKAGIITAHRAGVAIVFGTDGGVLPHGANAREFAALVNAGIPAIDAIRAATTVSAAALGRSGSMGAIAPGRRADLIAVDGDPLTDITALSRVVRVVRDGRLVK